MVERNKHVDKIFSFHSLIKRENGLSSETHEIRLRIQLIDRMPAQYMSRGTRLNPQDWDWGERRKKKHQVTLTVNSNCV